MPLVQFFFADRLPDDGGEGTQRQREEEGECGGREKEFVGTGDVGGLHGAQRVAEERFVLDLPAVMIATFILYNYLVCF